MLLNCVLETTLKSSLDSKEIKPVNPKGSQSWIFIGRTDAEAETPILWPLDANNWLVGKHSDSGKDWGQQDKGTVEDEMIRWYHWLDGHEFEQALGVGDGQGSLVCCRPWGHREIATTEWTNWCLLSKKMRGWFYPFSHLTGAFEVTQNSCFIKTFSASQWQPGMYSQEMGRTRDWAIKTSTGWRLQSKYPILLT